MNPSHTQQLSDDSDRTNRFLASHGSETPTSLSLRERAASQPPHSHSSNQAFLASSPHQSSLRTNSSGGPPGWPRISSALNPNSLQGSLPQSVPTRSASFSTTSPNAQTLFASAMRDRQFPSTFEDDESEVSDIQDPYDDRYGSPSNAMFRGRSIAVDLTRSRSQSIATTRPGMQMGGAPSSYWNESALSANALNIAGRYGELKPPGASRYGSLGTIGRSPSNGYAGSLTDHSNMSPFVRDVGQILLDEGSAFKELWAGNNALREEHGGGSGTTSRRHSVSVIQPRARPSVVGFNAPESDVHEEFSRPHMFHSSSFAAGGTGGLLLTDDDLAGDLLNLNLEDRQRTSSYVQPPSQPSSLPTYAPLPRSPPSADRVSPYQALHLNIPGGSSYASRQALGSPSDSGLSAGSPSRSQIESEYLKREAAAVAAGRGLTARFVPGYGIQHIPESSILHSPIAAVGTRPHYPQPHSPQIQRRPSDATKPLNELGKGVPLHSVPTSWPLYIVEFKAGRTDLFYCQDLAQDIRVGDLVIVEADRGKDLGKVVNDTITLAEVEAFQKQQKLMNVADAHVQGGPTSPTTVSSGGVKDINPKMIYGKASAQDTQHLTVKLQDEAKALELCRSKVRQRKLPMEVIDAEYQWDRRKLTFYFVAEKRIDFRELVRELFRLYKTRIWMASLGGAGIQGGGDM